MSSRSSGVMKLRASSVNMVCVRSSLARSVISSRSRMAVRWAPGSVAMIASRSSLMRSTFAAEASKWKKKIRSFGRKIWNSEPRAMGFGLGAAKVTGASAREGRTERLNTGLTWADDGT